MSRPATAEEVADAAGIMLRSMHAAAAASKQGAHCVICHAPFRAKHRDSCPWQQLVDVVRRYEKARVAEAASA